MLTLKGITGTLIRYKEEKTQRRGGGNETIEADTGVT